MTAAPNESLAGAIAEKTLGEPIARTVRFTTGNHHYVYDVEAISGQRCVVRLTVPEERRHFEGALYWSEYLRPLGMPFPKIVAHDLNAAFPYLVLERLPGRDLGEVYSTLSESKKRKLAADMAALHARLSILPLGSGYGYAYGYDAPFPHVSWNAVIAESLQRSRTRMKAGGVIDPAVIDPVAAEAELLGEYFSAIPPTPFLHDTTTKNVIIDNGRLSGVVDVDSLCFGDPLLVIALTQMGLLAGSHATDYIEYWCSHLTLSNVQRRALIFYTAQCCVDFMGEIGQTFNGIPLREDETYILHLSKTLKGLLQ